MAIEERTIPCKKGDVNGDGVCDYQDLDTIQYIIDNDLCNLANPNYAGRATCCAADVNSDGIIDDNDITSLQLWFQETHSNWSCPMDDPVDPPRTRQLPKPWS